MTSIVERRRALLREARERQRETLPKLREAVKKARANKRARVAKCRKATKQRRDRLQRDVERQREQLRERIAKARQKAREAATVCRVNANEHALERIDQALQAVEKERQAIAELRSRAGVMKSSRGQAGGRRAAELRAESDDEVRRDLGDDDPMLLELWERVKGKIKGSKRRTRTEAFLEFVHDNPDEYNEQVRRAEARWEREAEEYYEQLKGPAKLGELDDDELAERVGTWRRADRMLEAVPF